MGVVEVREAYEPGDDALDTCIAVLRIGLMDGIEFHVEVSLSQNEDEFPMLGLHTWGVELLDSDSEDNEVTMTTKVDKHVHQGYRWIAGKWTEITE